MAGNNTTFNKSWTILHVVIFAKDPLVIFNLNQGDSVAFNVNEISVLFADIVILVVLSCGLDPLRQSSSESKYSNVTPTPTSDILS